MDSFIIGIGKRIKKIRKENGDTISTIAERADVSNGLISRIENGRTIPSLPVLFGIIQALDIEVSDFFREISNDKANAFTVIRAEDQEVIEKEDEAVGFYYKHIFSKQVQNMGFETVLLEIDPGSERGKVETDAYELKFMLDGVCSYVIGDSEIELYEGDTLFFDGRIPHVPVCKGPERARMLVIYFYL